MTTDRLPYDCDALLPQAERVASLRFRRFYGHVTAYSQWEDAAELVAFLHVVPVQSARYIFAWGPKPRAYARHLLKHLSPEPKVQDMVEANRAAITFGAAWACYRAMREGGWVKGEVPPMVRAMMLEMMSRGLSRPQVGKELGLTVDQVRVMTEGKRAAATSHPRASMLAIG